MAAAGFGPMAMQVAAVGNSSNHSASSDDFWNSEYKCFSAEVHDTLNLVVAGIFIFWSLHASLAAGVDDDGPKVRRRGSASRRAHNKQTVNADLYEDPEAAEPLISTPAPAQGAGSESSRRNAASLGGDQTLISALLAAEVYGKQTYTFVLLVVTQLAVIAAASVRVYTDRAVLSSGPFYTAAWGVVEPVLWLLFLASFCTHRLKGLCVPTRMQIMYCMAVLAASVRFFDLEQAEAVDPHVYHVTRNTAYYVGYAGNLLVLLLCAVDVFRERGCKLYEINSEAKLLSGCQKLVVAWIDGNAAKGLSKRFADMSSAERHEASKEFVEKKIGAGLCLKLLFRMVMNVDGILMVLGLLGAVMGAVGSVILPLAIGQATDAAARAMYHRTQEAKDAIDQAGRDFILPIVMISLGQFLNGLFVEVSGTRLISRIQRMVFVSIVKQDSSYFDDNKVGELTSLLSTNVAMMRGGMTTSLASCLSGVLRLVLGLVFMLHGLGGDNKGSPSLFGTIIALGCPAVVAICILMVVGTKFSKIITERSAKSNGVATEMIGASKTLFSFNLGTYAEEKYAQAVRHTTAAGIQKDVLQGILMGVTYGSWMSAVSLGWYFGGLQVYEGKITMKYLATFLSLISNVMQSVMMIFAILPSLGAAIGAANNLLKPILMRPSINDRFHKGRKLGGVQGHVSLSGVEFAFPSKRELKVFEDLSINIPSGSSVAIVGMSGSGKSTILQLVERFYDADQGCVTIDGVDVKDLDVEWLRDTIGMVMQEPKLLSGTIRENIECGFPDATMHDVEQAAKLANAHNFILEQPDGYDTKIGEGGATLSGGQKQRIAIARAVVKDPRILLLDEATSALDSTAEIEVQKALEVVQKGRTTLTVAHRQSAIENADVIYVLDQGKIVEIGTHEELLKTGKIYQELYGGHH